MGFRGVLLIGLAGAALLSGCGHGARGASPASVVRAWSRALNAGDNQTAAGLFAPGARVIQAGQILRLRTHADAVAFNAALPCSGKVLSVSTKGDTATATFRLGDRLTSACDGPGQHARALFEVRDGKIFLWDQLPSPRPAPTRTA